MINGERVLGVVPARGASKEIPRKNLVKIAGKSLLGWTVEVAQRSMVIDYLIVSTDDMEIAAEAKRLGCEAPFIRHSELATDTTDAPLVAIDAATRCAGFEWIVLLQPTSPLRTTEDVDNALQQCAKLQAPACVSVCAVKETPYWMFTRGTGSRLIPVLQETPMHRQHLPQVYVLNGAVYVARTDWLKREGRFLASQTVAYEMPRERSLDIDTEADLCEFRRLTEGEGASCESLTSPLPD